MIPIRELLDRIRWDKAFGAAEFALGYYDRVERRIIVVPFRAIQFDPGDHFSFQLMDDEGGIHTVPLHRVKEVYRDGRLIWQRQH